MKRFYDCASCGKTAETGWLCNRCEAAIGNVFGKKESEGVRHMAKRIVNGDGGADVIQLVMRPREEEPESSEVESKQDEAMADTEQPSTD